MGKYKVRPTGVSVGGVGLQWEYRTPDAEIARRVLAFLDDRRMLWNDYALEVPDEAMESARDIRRFLTEQIMTEAIGPGLAALLTEVRHLFGNFMDAPRVGDFGERSPMGPPQLTIALGELRAAVGDRLAVLASNYDLEVGEGLRRIVPDSGAWLFERFDDSGR